MTEQTPDVPHVEPLAAPIESVARHDLYINRRFREIFEAEENADLARAFTVALPANDTDPRPIVVETAESEPVAVEVKHEGPPRARIDYTPDETDGVTFGDAYGDELRAMYGEQVCETHGREPFVAFMVNDGQPVVMEISYLPEFVAWLQSRVEKGEAARGEGQE